MSVSILRDGRLWGLIACHDPEPHYIDYETRSAVELFIRLFSFELSLREEQSAWQRIERQEILISELNHRMRNIFDLVGGIVAGTSSRLRPYRIVPPPPWPAFAPSPGRTTN